MMIQVSKQSCTMPFTTIVTRHQRHRDGERQASDHQSRPRFAHVGFFLEKPWYRINPATMPTPRGWSHWRSAMPPPDKSGDDGVARSHSGGPLHTMQQTSRGMLNAK
jgi:hypothetical protein